jgi:hypothetical protein
VRGERAENLAELVLRPIARDEETPRGERTGRKTGVAREQDALLFEGDAQDLIVPEGGIVGNIMAQQPQALRKAAEHCVGDELHNKNSR